MSNVAQFTGEKVHHEFADAQESICDHVMEVCEGMPFAAVLGILKLVEMQIIATQEIEIEE
ncbi:MAG: hypothetical protein AAGJ17_00060 [Pseudomonadota bacterium]